MAYDITDTVYFSNWCMEVSWNGCFDTYPTLNVSSYKHWHVECVGDNHPLIILNKIGCIFTLVYGYWKYHEMGVLIFILHYFLVKHWNVECVWDNHPFILHLLVVFYILVYWLILDVLILVVFYTLVYWLIKVSKHPFNNTIIFTSRDVFHQAKPKKMSW